MLKIYNTLNKQKEEFKPLEPGKVKMYVCGMTVYDYCHVGHARVMVFFDTVVRHLEAIGFEVNYVRNITDIDDKIINRANDNNEDFKDLVNRFVVAMHEDTAQLSIEEPSIEPRATESMDEIIKMIQTMLDKDMAYITDNGDVYFAVDKFKSYGKLSGKNIEDLQAGIRVEVNDIKRNPMDFALWKSAKPDEPSWEAPWGTGRPGWHIECSAMSFEHLGTKFDIHGGGMDLIFPHHENEIAQSEACVGHQHVNTWMHVGFVKIDDEKMSKSLNNFFTIREVLTQYSPEVVRMFLLSSHYRSPLNYSKTNLDNAGTALARLYASIRNIKINNELEVDKTYQDKFNQAMNDDFNTPEALAVLFDLTRTINRKHDAKEDVDVLSASLVKLGSRLGVLQQNPEEFLTGGVAADDATIDDLISKRNQARADKDWALADEIRDKLKDLKVILEDGGDGTSWRRG